MLTRLKVSGFKNLVDVDVRFGPFTCIAGANGVGKSNLLDAIRFLSLTLLKPDVAGAAQSTRGGSDDPSNLLHKVGAKFVESMSFEVESEIRSKNSEFKEVAYSILMTVRSKEQFKEWGRFRVDAESLRDKGAGEVYLKTNIKPDGKFPSFYFDLYNDSSVSLNWTLPFEKTGYTGLSTANSIAGVGSTLNSTREELQSWKIIHMNPVSIRHGCAEKYNTQNSISDDGNHIASALYRIAHEFRDEDGNPDPELIYLRASNRLFELVGDVRSLRVEDNEDGESYALCLTDRYGTELPADSFSDGTLRFLALITLWLDPKASGVFCIEEPENGIHPARLPALVRLLQDIARDPNEPVGPDNPFRQVIIVTHSPEVVKLVPDDSLLVARSYHSSDENGGRYTGVYFVPLPGTWRVDESTRATEMASRNELLTYLNPSVTSFYVREDEVANGDQAARPRVMDRDELRPLRSLK